MSILFFTKLDPFNKVIAYLYNIFIIIIGLLGQELTTFINHGCHVNTWMNKGKTISRLCVSAFEDIYVHRFLKVNGVAVLNDRFFYQKRKSQQLVFKSGFFSVLVWRWSATMSPKYKDKYWLAQNIDDITLRLGVDTIRFPKPSTKS